MGLPFLCRPCALPLRSVGFLLFVDSYGGRSLAIESCDFAIDTDCGPPHVSPISKKSLRAVGANRDVRSLFCGAGFGRFWTADLVVSPADKPIMS